jgi:hypothetical protein
MSARASGIVIAVSAVLGSAPALGATVTFVGSASTDWFDPLNWSTGAVPGADDEVVIEGSSVVVIDPARGSASVSAGKMTLKDFSLLKTLPGTVLTTTDTFLMTGEARLEAQSTEFYGDLFVADCDGDTLCGMRLNPTPKSKRDVILKTSIVEFGLGGTTRAGPGATGPGHYATIDASERIELDAGVLVDTFLLYGFQPRPGDSFTIMSAPTIIGGFANVSEDEPVARYRRAILFLRKQGSDQLLDPLSGQSLTTSEAYVLEAVQVPEPATWAMLLAGFGLIGSRFRRGRPILAA